MKFLIAVLLVSTAWAGGKPCKDSSDCKKHGEHFVCQTVKTGCPGMETHSTCASLQCVEIKPKK